MSTRTALAWLLALALAGCSAAPEAVLECRGADGIRLVCGLQNPEDLAVLVEGEAVVFSEFGSMDGSRAGSLSVLDLATDAVTVAFQGGSTVEPVEPVGEPSPFWGDPDCPGPPDASFTPHGIDLAPLPDGTRRLLVVNHGGRESVELFQVDGRNLVWRGCALPGDAVLNDVVALPDGGFLATRMFGSESQLWLFAHVLLRLETGHVLEWQPGAGFRAVPGTAAALPNGIEVSADGSSIYLSAYGNNEVRRISRTTGELTAWAEVPRPDNLTWSPDGRLLAASQLGSLREVIACNQVERGTCRLACEIVALDPDTLERRVIFSSAGDPVGAASVGLQVGDELLVGTYAGDRIARVRLAP